MGDVKSWVINFSIKIMGDIKSWVTKIGDDDDVCRTYFKDNHKRLMAFNFLVEVGRKSRQNTNWYISPYTSTYVQFGT